ncbi:hypothetical protein QA648_02065 [Rhizobium sp. CB3171]|uniref:hypothetical protein n=1 Tax=Rhizobium sp. CB3171 TaxID=3039157 RepID=UPI0024B1ABB9|nr:hypothetical protein [Rhizobium sp. CB3171]WFU04221.1 hypothetical protein QA648_02065 [Rhizobium sp. CB3171]
MAKIAPTAAEVNNLPVIVNLPSILMGMFTSSGGATPLADHHRAGSLRKMVERGFSSGKSCGKRLHIAFGWAKITRKIKG